jgi:predicted TIM-barrel fold metal-dependent hydrolase
VWPPALRSTLEFLGPEHIMFGSDYPFWDPQRSFDALDAAGFPDTVVERVRSGNARRLFGLGDESLAGPVGAQRENPPR